MTGDMLSVEGDGGVGEPLIRQFMKGGRRVSAGEPLYDSRKRTLAEIKRLPSSLLSLQHVSDYPVVVSEALRDLARQVDAGQSTSPPTISESKSG
jgi:nicotinate phosphoribosyltransferase